MTEFKDSTDLVLKEYYDNVIVVRDNNLNKDVDVIISKGCLFCDYHEGQDRCPHIEFVNNVSEINKLKKNGKIK